MRMCAPMSSTPATMLVSLSSSSLPCTRQQMRWPARGGSQQKTPAARAAAPAGAEASGRSKTSGVAENSDTLTWRGALAVWQQMMRNDQRPLPEMWRVVLRACRDAGDEALQEAQMLLEFAEREGVPLMAEEDWE